MYFCLLAASQNHGFIVDKICALGDKERVFRLVM